MNILETLGDALSEVGTVIGSVLVETVSNVLDKLPVVLDKAIVVVSAISMVVVKVGELLNIASNDENPAELGAKVLQDGTRSIEPEETAQEYLDYLRNSVELDKNKFETMTEVEKINCEVVGDVILAKSIEEKIGIEITGDFLITIPKADLKYVMVSALMKSFSNAEISSLNEFTRYISNDMSDTEATKIGNAVKEAIRDILPEMSQKDIQKEIVNMKQIYFLNESMMPKE